MGRGSESRRKASLTSMAEHSEVRHDAGYDAGHDAQHHTIADVADRAGVSIATVSRVLNRTTRVSDETSGVCRKPSKN